MIYYKKIGLLNLLNLLTIACSISYKVTILPYMIFNTFQYSEMFPLVLITLEIFTIIVNSVKGLTVRTDFLKFRPLATYFGIMVIQFLIACAYFRINSIGATILYSTDCFLLCILIYSLCIRRVNEHDISEAIPSEYLILSYINVLLVCSAAILMTTHIIPIMINDVSDRCVLFEGNVEGGQRYYMPYYISLQNSTRRLTNLGELTGWAFEPHLFWLLVFPSMFFSLGRSISNKKKLFVICLFLFSATFAFSVTGLLSLIIVSVVMLFCEGTKSWIKFTIVVLCVGLFFLFFGDFAKDSILVEYTTTKLVDNTTSADYSKSNLEWCMSPISVFGQGVMRWDLEHNNHPDIGVISFIILIVYFVSTLFNVIRVILSDNKQIRYIGYGVLYMLLHSLKMANAVFYMPLISMYLVILFIAYQNISENVSIKS